MTRAAEILRERAAVAAGQGRTRDCAVIGAVADLVKDCHDQSGQAMCCHEYPFSGRHTASCKLAALEREILKGESDAALE